MRQQTMTITKNGLMIGYISPVTDLPTSQEQYVPIDTGGGTYQAVPKTLMPIQGDTTLVKPTVTDLVTPKDGTSSLYVAGSITDEQGKPIPSVLVTVTLLNGTVLAGPNETTTGQYDAWTDQDPNNVYLYFAANGFAVGQFLFSKLMQSPNVILKKETAPVQHKIPTWAILLVLAAVALSARTRKKAVGFGLGDIPWFIWATGGILAFSIIQKILIKIGLWDSKATKDLDAAQNNPNSFWSPSYWQHIKPANANWSYAFTTSQATTMCQTIYDSFGAFNDDEDTVIGVFKQCRTKANCSFLAYTWQQLYGSDLLTYIRGGLWPSDRLSDADTSVINTYISNLPDY